MCYNGTNKETGDDFVANKICPVCGKEYDDEVNEACPFCSGNVSKENEAQAAPEEENVSVVDASDDLMENQEDLQDAQENEDAISPQEEIMAQGADDALADDEAQGGANKTLKIVAIILGAALVVLALFFTYTRFIAPKDEKNAFVGLIDSEVGNGLKNGDKFTASDLDTTFSDKVNLIYYTFINEKAKIEIPTDTQEVPDPEADSSADSSGQATKTVVVASETREYDGTYTSGMTQEGVRRMVIINYIESQGLAQEYMEYIEEKGIVDNDFEGFVKEKGLEADINIYDSENGLSQEIAFDKTEGYWNLDENIISLFDEKGNQVGEYIITEKGIINADYLYKGAIPNEDDLVATYSMVSEDYGTTQELTIRLYRDGYSILEVGGMSESLQAGTYESDEKGIYINLGGQSIFFYVTDMGICNEILTK